VGPSRVGRGRTTIALMAWAGSQACEGNLDFDFGDSLLGGGEAARYRRVV
jgi:hypothetical protein